MTTSSSPNRSAQTLPPARAALFARLDALSIAHRTVEHPAFFTVEEGRAYKATMPGGHSKNLFVKDKAGVLTLAVALGDTRADLVGLGKRLGSKGRLSFGSAELMGEVLSVTPGSVTPLALFNDRARRISTVVVDTALLAHETVWFHPLENTASTAISRDDFLKFLRAEGPEPLILDLANPQAR